MAPQYPLEALRKLRDERAEAQSLKLAEQVARCQAAQLVLGQRERARREQEARAAESLKHERDRIARVGASGAELSRVADFERAAQAQAELLRRAEADARAAWARERSEEERLRRELSEREAEAELVRGHEARFHERQAENLHKAAEEAALEQWNARRR